MATARALVLEEPGRLVDRRLPLPGVGDDDGLLRIEACGLCGTDHEQLTGHLPAPYAFVPGHEIVGTVEEVGAAAAARWDVRAGDRVAVEVFLSCRSCEPCRSGLYRRCRRHGLRDMYGFRDVADAPGLWGGYATHLYLAPDALVLPVPDGLDPVMATLFNPLGAGLRWTVTVPALEPGAVVSVLGPGIRGLCAAAAAKGAGAGFVMVTGVGPADDDRLAMASAFGADLAVDVSAHDPVASLRGATGVLADVVVDVTATAPTAFVQALDLVRPGGTVVVAGTRGAATLDRFSPDVIVYKEITVVGALGVDAEAYRAALDLLASGAHPFADLPRRIADLDGAEELVRAMAGEGGADRPVHAVICP